MVIQDSELGRVEVDISHASDPVDSVIESGYSITLDRELTDEELDRLTNTHGDRVHQDWFEHQIDRAEYMYGDGIYG